MVLSPSTRDGEDLQLTSICKEDGYPNGHDVYDRTNPRELDELCREIGVVFGKDRIFTVI